ncbi:hypothetical protein JTB14_016985 [Gonioctena quinquepunctata]|nr:hypothetical protein JTB14_016985 [Gonioctena quinquepunctata]
MPGSSKTSTDRRGAEDKFFRGDLSLYRTMFTTNGLEQVMTEGRTTPEDDRQVVAIYLSKDSLSPRSRGVCMAKAKNKLLHKRSIRREIKEEPTTRQVFTSIEIPIVITKDQYPGERRGDPKNLTDESKNTFRGLSWQHDAIKEY